MAALAVAIVAVSTSAILIRFSNAPSGPMAFWRVTLTLLLLAPLSLRSGAEFQKFDRRDLLSALLAGLALAAHFATWFESVDKTTVAASVTLVTTQPAFVAVGAYFLFGESLSRRSLAGIGVALAGSAVMSLDGLLGGTTAPEPVLGNLLALAGAVLAGLYVLAGRSVRQRVNLVPYVTVVYVVCAGGLLAYSLALGDPVLAYPPREWLLFLGMAIGPGLLGHTVVNWALAHVESSVVSVSFVGEPVGSTVLALVILGEVPGALTLAGGAIVIGGIYLTARGRR
ncbi:EamA family transporter [Halosegnis rubeus]|uniref:EamA family transporter n=1 Tax=Halosegnis rubeus TaxID=2212850 RepID=A0A5N5UAD0_9EURY|nr:DMT family transporter [Halosegnis rubeus]KAB7512700.1 EamA family transporter [Halosegnis rubeus]KAB7515564.1 EamA family transporter [Halosegnis rubeus]